MLYRIKWKGETVDTATSKKDAMYLVREYNIAFHGGVSCKQLEN